eukprot:TRINITY_DN185111_c0_g1_i2.p1 TRINITY_DN185111_c0_g1~~TRINITY_DN185111_c0_g1_i2.p1  ORF type:complete len:484 (+),score=144.82 TRINITY_DN185111_c0_g1_i2:350-1801(+)
MAKFFQPREFQEYGLNGEELECFGFDMDFVFEGSDRKPSVVTALKRRYMNGMYKNTPELEAVCCFEVPRSHVLRALDQFKGPYGKVGCARTDVTFDDCACDRKNPHTPTCRRTAAVLLRVIITPEEAKRREFERNLYTKTMVGMKERLEQWLMSPPGEKVLVAELMLKSRECRQLLTDFEGQVADAKKVYKRSLKDLKRVTKRVAKFKAGYRYKNHKLRDKAHCREVLSTAKMEVTEKANILKDLRKLYLQADLKLLRTRPEWFSALSRTMARQVRTRTTTKFLERMRETALEKEWRRPWDGPNGEDYEDWKRVRIQGDDGEALYRHDSDHGDEALADFVRDLLEPKDDPYQHVEKHPEFYFDPDIKEIQKDCKDIERENPKIQRKKRRKRQFQKFIKVIACCGLGYCCFKCWSCCCKKCCSCCSKPKVYLEGSPSAAMAAVDTWDNQPDELDGEPSDLEDDDDLSALFDSDFADPVDDSDSD